MSIDEYFAPVTHKHTNCPICNNEALIQDIPTPRSNRDKLMIEVRNNNAGFRILQGKRINVREG